MGRAPCDSDEPPRAPWRRDRASRTERLQAGKTRPLRAPQRVWRGGPPRLTQQERKSLEQLEHDVLAALAVAPTRRTTQRALEENSGAIAELILQARRLADWEKWLRDARRVASRTTWASWLATTLHRRWMRVRGGGDGKDRRQEWPGHESPAALDVTSLASPGQASGA